MTLEFEDYVRQAQRPLLRLAVVLTDDAERAQDIVQDVLLRAGALWSKIDGVAAPHAYVRRMVINEVVSWHRKWGRIQPRPLTDLDCGESDATSVVDRRDAILRELARLPVRQKTVVVLRYFEDMTDAQIGEVLGCRPATVRVHLHRALKALRVDEVVRALSPVR